MTVDTLLSLEMAAGGNLVTKPGTEHAYSNDGYVMLGILVGKLYGKNCGAVCMIEFGVPFAGKAPQRKAATPAPAPETLTPADRTKLIGVYALSTRRTFEVPLEKGSCTSRGATAGNSR